MSIFKTCVAMKFVDDDDDDDDDVSVESHSTRPHGVWYADCQRHGVSGGPEVCTSRPGCQKLHVSSFSFIFCHAVLFSAIDNTITRQDWICSSNASCN